MPEALITTLFSKGKEGATKPLPALDLDLDLDLPVHSHLVAEATINSRSEQMVTMVT